MKKIINAKTSHRFLQLCGILFLLALIIWTLTLQEQRKATQQETPKQPSATSSTEVLLSLQPKSNQPVAMQGAIFKSLQPKLKKSSAISPTILTSLQPKQ